MSLYYNLQTVSLNCLEGTTSHSVSICLTALNWLSWMGELLHIVYPYVWLYSKLAVLVGWVEVFLKVSLRIATQNYSPSPVPILAPYSILYSKLSPSAGCGVGRLIHIVCQYVWLYSRLSLLFRWGTTSHSVLTWRHSTMAGWVGGNFWYFVPMFHSSPVFFN